ncbi:GNAT family N-acetyltransferase [Candidatus Hodarchaeum mangrovi]
MEKVIIREYSELDEHNWIKCYLHSYSSSIYLNTMEETKPRYETPSIQLIAEKNQNIIGILDIIFEEVPGQLGSDLEQRSGIITVLGVLPSHRRTGIGMHLLKKAELILNNIHKVYRCEVWSREDVILDNFWSKLKFLCIDHYYEVYYSDDFFERFNINFPFEITPQTFIASVNSHSFSKLVRDFAPDRSFKIKIWEKSLY